MVDTIGQAEIRGIDINKTAIVFGEEESILINFVVKSPASARELRYYQKASGFLDTIPAIGTQALSQIPKASEGAIPVKIKQKWTRLSAGILLFKAESEMITIEDIKDNDVDIFNTHLKDIVRGVVNQRDIHIYSVFIEAAAATPTTPNPTTILNTVAVADGWDDLVTGNPIFDLMKGNQLIRSQGNKTQDIIAYMNPIEHLNLVNYLITVKGSSLVPMAAELAKSGAVGMVAGNTIVVSENATTDFVLQFIPNSAVTYREFMPLSTAIIDEPLVGKTIRVATEGVAYINDPNKIHLIKDTVVA